jgi:hypothetical protein
MKIASWWEVQRLRSRKYKVGGMSRLFLSLGVMSVTGLASTPTLSCRRQLDGYDHEAQLIKFASINIQTSRIFLDFIVNKVGLRRHKVPSYTLQ